MIKLSQEKVLILHEILTEETGGDPGVRDIALLNSALESAFATFGGQELYPTREEKAARIGFSLIACLKGYQFALRKNGIVWIISSPR